MRALRIALRLAALLLLGGVLLAWWWLGSGGGRDLTLDRVIAALPEGALRIGAREGSLAGGLRLRDVAYEDASLRVEIDVLEATPRWPGLPTPAINLSRLSARGLRVAMKPAPDTPSPPWPEVLPRLDLDLGVDVAIDAVQVRDMAVWPAPDASTRATDAGADSTDGAVRMQALDAVLRLVDGRLAVDGLRVEAPQGRLDGALAYAPAENFATQLRADARLAAGARLAVVLEGSLTEGRLAIEGEAGGPVRLVGDWRDAATLEALAWTVDAELQGFDAATVGLAAQPAVDAALQARGGASPDAAGGHAVALEGRIARDGVAVELRPSRLRLDGERLHAEPLALSLLDGRLDLVGAYGLDDGAMVFDAQADALAWGDGEARVQASGTARVEGRPEAWTAALGLDLRRGAQQARLDADARGDAGAVVLAPFTFTTPGGVVQGEGRYALDAAAAFTVQARVQGLDPAWLLPAWPGRLDARLRVDGAAPADAPLRLDARLEGLRGPLRDEPIAGDLRVRGEGERFTLDLDLSAGEGGLQAEGRIAPALDLAVVARRFDLAPWVDGVRGVVDGRLQLDGDPARPGVEADLVVLDSAYGEVAVQRLTARGRLPARGDGELALRAEGATQGEQRIDTLGLDLTGAIEAARFTLDARAERARLAATGDWRAESGFARGELALERLDAGARGVPPLTLAAPARLAWSEAGPSLPEALCLRIGARGRLCAEGDADALDLQGEALELAWLAPLLQEARDAPLPAMDPLALRATLRREADGRALVAELASEGLRFDARGRLGDDDALAGDLTLRATDLAWLELLSADLAAPQGRLEGRLQVAGSVAAPRWQGRVALAPFSAELPALGIVIREGEVRVDGREDGSLVLEGRLPTGDGALELAGRWSPEGGPSTISVRGSDVRVLDTPDGQAWVSPALDVAIDAGIARVRGRVDVPRADLRLDRFEQTVAVSPDVVVVDDPAPAEAATGIQLDADLRLALGEDVRLRGFGFDGRLAGELRVRDRLDREPRASGALTLSGELRAYGQQLDLTRGAIRWANAPIDEPVLDVLAERPDSDPQVGVALTGSALAPVAEVWSKPALPQAEALSWLMFGRPLASADGDDAAQLEQAATSLGGSAVAQAVAGKVGLDAASVGQSRALGGTAVTVGKRITPKLYVSYGMALSGTGQVVTVTYALRRWLAAKLESGIEQRLELEATIDRD